MAKLAKLKTLVAKAGRWLGLERPQPPTATGAVVDDHYDAMTWADVCDQVPALEEMIEDLSQDYACVPDLVRDVFLLAYKALPQLRDLDQMAPSRRPNHAIVSTMLDTPEMTAMRARTAGSTFSSALATVAQTEQLREILKRAAAAAAAAAEAQQAADRAQQAADAVAAAAEQAGAAADADGNLPSTAAAALTEAIETAEAADNDAAAAAGHAASAAESVPAAVRGPVRSGLAAGEHQVRAHDEVMAAWGVGPGVLEKMSYAERADLAARLTGGRLAQFTDMIGLFRTMAYGERTRRVEGVAGELVGVTLGDDLTRMVPSELAALALPSMRADFLARWAEGRIMVQQMRAEEKQGKGAIVAAIDCSGSMRDPLNGTTREVWAKALALALLDQARAARPPRDFVGILFASEHEIETFRFPAGEPVAIQDVIEFTEHFFNGGTSFSAPMDAAGDILETEFTEAGRANGDVVLVTDGECGVSPDWMRAHLERKHRLDFRTWAVAVASTIGPTLQALGDNSRTIADITTPAPAADMFRSI